jgi:chromosome segregation ATPase
MDVEAEIAELQRRVAVLEDEVKADRQFSVRMFGYIRELRDDVAVLRSHAMVMDGRVSRLEERMARVESDIAALRAEFTAFRQELPGMIAETMREVLREYRAR